MCLRTTSSAPGAVWGLKPRVTDPVSGSAYVKVRRVARVVAPLQIDVFAMQCMVEISCLRKSATSSFCKVLLHNTRWPWFRKSLDVGPVIVILMFSKMQKSVVFLVFTALLVRWDLAFAGSFCRLPLCGGATAFACF